jgi:hypothetical protein
MSERIGVIAAAAGHGAGPNGVRVEPFLTLCHRRSMSTYVAGQCNIGGPEVRTRRFFGWMALGIACVLAGLLLLIDADRTLRVGIFLPLLGSAIGFVQARRRFCMAYGWRGVFNFDRLGKISRVDDDIARRADRRMVLRLLAESIAYAAVVTVVFYLVP